MISTYGKDNLSKFINQMNGRSPLDIYNQFWHIMRRRLRRYNLNQDRASRLYNKAKHAVRDPNMFKILMSLEENLTQVPAKKKTPRFTLKEPIVDSETDHKSNLFRISE